MLSAGRNCLNVRICKKADFNKYCVSLQQLCSDGLFRVEYDNYYIALRGEMVRLQRAEFLVLSRLVQVSERFVLAEELWSCVWGTQREFNSMSIRVYVSHVRQLLEPFGIKIENMPNVGYRFIPHSKFQ